MCVYLFVESPWSAASFNDAPLSVADLLSSILDILRSVLALLDLIPIYVSVFYCTVISLPFFC